MTDAYEQQPECPWDAVLQEDLEIIAGDDRLAAALEGKRILITGATGLVGSQLTRSLACMNRMRDNGMRIYGVIRSTQKARKIYGEAFLQRNDVRLLQGDITSPDLPALLQHQIAETFGSPDKESSADKIRNSEEGVSVCASDSSDSPSHDNAGTVDLVIHGASVTASKVMVEKPVETILTAVEGTKHLLDFARAAGAKSFVYLSSMEMYGNLEADTLATEDRLGWLDLMNVRSDYPESKRLCENLCIGYGHEYGLNVKIARLAQTFGAGILEGENRVFAQFTRSAMQGEDIVLHTRGLSEGNYCYTRDAVRGILTIAAYGANGQAYNVANEAAHTTIADMAQMVAECIAGGAIRVVYDIPESNVFGYAADTKLRLDSSKLRFLGWEPEVGLEEMYRRLIASMSSNRQ